MPGAKPTPDTGSTLADGARRADRSAHRHNRYGFSLRSFSQVITVHQGSYVDEWASLLDEPVREESEETDRADRQFDWNDGGRSDDEFVGDDGRGR